MKIILIGFATSYKTSVGKKIAKQLNMEFFDVDTLVESVCNQTVQQIFDTHGEEFFRAQENAVVLQLAQKDNCVVSCGGGSIKSQNFVYLRQNAQVIWLKVSAKTVFRRLNGLTRPLFDNLTLEQLCNKVEERNGSYQLLCDFSVCTDNKTSTQIASEVLAILSKHNR